jgi:hypothetical protein
MTLVSSSEKVSYWLSEIKHEWSVYAQKPDYLRDVLSDQQFKDLQVKLASIRNLQRNLSSSLAEAHRSYKEKVAEVHAEFDPLFVSARSDDILWVYTLRFQQLPLKQIVEVLEYDEGSYNGMTRDEYQDYVLARFKKSTISKLLANKIKREDVIPS